jgi:hypothetical protein
MQKYIFFFESQIFAPIFMPSPCAQFAVIGSENQP